MIDSINLDFWERLPGIKISASWDDEWLLDCIDNVQIIPKVILIEQTRKNVPYIPPTENIIYDS